MKGRVLALTAGVTLLACGSTTVTKSGQPTSPHEPTCDFAIYTVPPEGYAEVGSIDVSGGLYGANTFRDLNDFKDHIRPAVCNLGGDAAVAWANGQGIYIKATVIRHVTSESSVATGSSSRAQAATDSGITEAVPEPGSAPIGTNATTSSERKSFPPDALGFAFGTTPEEAQELCMSLDHQWRVDGETYECTGAAVNVGAPVSTTLSYCDGALCELRAYVTLKKDKAGQRAFVKLQDALIEQYGKPTKDDIKFPTVCHDRVMACIVEGRARWESRWEWPDGSNIRAKAGADGGSPVIGIRYHWVPPKSDSATRDKEADEASSFEADAF
jgi:hypothetical protein